MNAIKKTFASHRKSVKFRSIWTDYEKAKWTDANKFFLFSSLLDLLFESLDNDILPIIVQYFDDPTIFAQELVKCISISQSGGHSIDEVFTIKVLSLLEKLTEEKECCLTILKISGTVSLLVSTAEFLPMPNIKRAVIRIVCNLLRNCDLGNQLILESHFRHILAFAYVAEGQCVKDSIELLRQILKVDIIHDILGITANTASNDNDQDTSNTIFHERKYSSTNLRDKPRGRPESGDVTSSLASKGFSIAVNVVGGLLRLTPLKPWIHSGVKSGAALDKTRAGNSAKQALDFLVVPLAVWQMEERRVESLMKERSALTQALAEGSDETISSEDMYHRPLDPTQPVFPLDIELGLCTNREERDLKAGTHVAEKSEQGLRDILVDVEGPLLPNQEQISLAEDSVAIRVMSMGDSEDSEDAVRLANFNLLRDNLLKQGVVEIIAHLLDSVTDSPSLLRLLDVTYALMLVHVKAQLLFANGNGYQRLAASFGKIVKTSLSIASESFLGDTATDFFEEVTEKLLMVVMDGRKLCLHSFTDSSTSQMSQGTVGNIESVRLIGIFLLSSPDSDPFVVAVGLRLMFGLLLQTPVNLVTLHQSGALLSFYSLFRRLATRRMETTSSYPCKEGVASSNAPSHESASSEDFQRIFEVLNKLLSPILCRSNKIGVADKLEATSSAICHLHSHILLSACTQLIKLVSVITSLRDSVPFSFLTSFLHRCSHLRNPSQLAIGFGLGDHEGTAWGKEINDEITCSNCESEVARFQCLQHSCWTERCSCLCRECDRVFHKAVSKRTHIRIPIQEVLLPERSLFGQDSSYGPPANSPSKQTSQLPNEYCDELDKIGGSLITVDAMLLTLRTVLEILDDRRFRGLSVDSRCFQIYLFLLRKLLIFSSDGSESFCPGLFDSMMRMDLNFPVDSLEKDFLICRNRTFDDPPEDPEFQPLRMCLSLLLQILSRFLVNETFPEQMQDPLQTKASLYQSDTILYLNSFRKFGGDAMFAFILTETSSRLRITSADKQFALWILREATVSALSLDLNIAAGLLQWLCWLLRCQVNGGDIHKEGEKNGTREIEVKPDLVPSDVPTSTDPSSHKPKSSTSAKKVVLEKKIQLQRFAPIPAATRTVYRALRLMIIQEIRVLLGGDDWEPVLTGDFSTTDSRFYGVPWVVRSNEVSTDGARDKDDASVASLKGTHQESPRYNNASVVPFRIPLSNAQVKYQFIRNGVIETLVNICFGNVCSPGILCILNGDNADMNDRISELEKEEWWSALAALAQLVSGCNSAKEVLVSCASIPDISKMTLPILSIPNIPQAITLFLIELCISDGRITPPGRPFIGCFRIPLSTSYSTGIHNQSPLLKSFKPKLPNENCTLQDLWDRSSMAELLSSEVESIDRYVCSLSPMYLVRQRCVQSMLCCFRPSPIILRDLGKSSTQEDHSLRENISFHGYSTSSIEGLDTSNRISRTASFSLSQHNLELDSVDDHSIGRASSVKSMSASLHHTGRQGRAGSIPHLHFDELTRIQTEPADEASSPLNSFHMAYSPLITTLRWGLEVDATYLVDSIHDAVSEKLSRFVQQEEKNLIDSTVRSATYMKRTPNFGQHLQLFAPPRGILESKMTWRPPFSTLKIRSKECLQVLLSLTLGTTGASQKLVISSVSHLLDGNPHNCDILSQEHVDGFIMQLLPYLDEKLRGAFSYILSQLMRYDVNIEAVLSLLKIARTLGDGIVDVVEVLRKEGIPAYGAASSSLEGKKMKDNATLPQSQGTSQTHFLGNQKSFVDFAGRLVMYVIGRTVERTCPADFIHFDQANPFTDFVLIPPLEKLPSARIGFTVNMWLRLGAIGDAPFCPLLQLTSGKEEEPVVTTFFFRLLYRTPYFNHDGDVGSVTSAATTTPGDFYHTEEVSKRILQLCASSTRSHKGSLRTTAPDKSTSSVNPPVSETHLSPFLKHYVGGFAIPDVVIDFDWSEMGEWHLLSIVVGGETATGVSFNCTVDGKVVPVLHWTPLGYHPLVSTSSRLLHDDNSGVFPYPQTSKEKPLRLSIGGFSSGLDEFNEFICNISTHIDRVKTTRLHSPESESSAEDSSDSLRRDLWLLQYLQSLIRGFCGMIGEICVVEGTADCVALSNVFNSGAINGFAGLTKKRLAYLQPSKLLQTEGFSSRFRGRDKSTQQEPQRGRGSRRADELPENEIPDSRRNSRSLSPATRQRATFVPSMTKTSTVDAVVDMSYGSPSRRKSGGDTMLNDLFTMFSGGGGKEDDRSKYSDFPAIQGDIQVYHTSLLQEDHVIQSVGGLGLWYPLLVIDRPRQVSMLRVLASLLIKSPAVLKEFQETQGENIILYCLHRTPGITSGESLQVFFDDMITLNNGVRSSQSPLSFRPEPITNPLLLRLLVHIIIASPRRPQLARAVIDWLRTICDDFNENTNIVLDSIGLIPFLIVLSLWTIGGSGSLAYMVGPQATENPNSMASFQDRFENSPRRSNTQRKANLSSWSGPIESVPTLELQRVQSSLGRILKVLLTGTSGDAQSCPYPTSFTPSSPLAFSVLHMSSIVNFLVYLLRRVEMERKRFDIDKNTKTPTPSARLRYLIDAITIVLSTLLGAIDSNYQVSSTLISFLRQTLEGSSLWLFLLEIMGCFHNVIRVRALSLFAVLITGADGMVDSKQLNAFEKCSGFQIMTEKLANNADDVDSSVIDSLFYIMFWRRSRRRGASSMQNGQATFLSPIREVFRLFKRFFSVSLNGLQDGKGGIFEGRNESRENDSCDDDSGAEDWEWDEPVDERQEFVNADEDSSSSQKVPTIPLGSDSYSEDPTPAVKFGGNTTPVKPNQSSSGMNMNTGSIIPAHMSPFRTTISDSREISEQSATGRSSVQPSANTPTSNSLFSMFSWRSSKQHSGVAGGDLASSETGQQIDVRRTSSAESDTQFKLANVVPVEDSVKASSTDESRPPVLESKSATATATTAVFESPIRERTILSTTLSRNSKFIRSHFQADSSTRNIELGIEQIYLPQILQPLFGILHLANNKDVVSKAAKTIEDCLTVPLVPMMHPESVLQGRVRFDNKTLQSLVYHNMVMLTNQPDWLIFIAECAQRLISRNAGSETLPHPNQPIHSDLAEGRVRSVVGPNTSYAVIPLLHLIVKIIHLDSRGKPSSSRRLFDVFALSHPQNIDFQATLLQDILDSFRSLTLSDPIEETLNILKNISLFLEQLPEKVDMPLEFNMRAIELVNYLAYQSPVTVRARIKETSLADVRNTYVIRCLLAQCETAVSSRQGAVIKQLHDPIANLVSSQESRILHSSQIALVCLGMFMETSEHLMKKRLEVESEALLLTDDGNPVTQVELTESKDEFYLSKLSDFQHATLVLIHSCVMISAECKKYFSKLFQYVDHQVSERATSDKIGTSTHRKNKSPTPGDILVIGFMNRFQDASSSSNNIAIVSSSGGVQPVGISEGINSNMRPSGTGATSSSWWGWGSATTSTAQNQEQSIQIERDAVDSSGGRYEVRSESSTKSSIDIERGSPQHGSTPEQPSNLLSLGVSESQSPRPVDTSSHPSEDAQAPMTTSDFMEWFNHDDQGDLRSELRKRIEKDLQIVSRISKKLNDQLEQRKDRFRLRLQEQRNKDQEMKMKAYKEQQEKIRADTDKRSLHFEYEVGRWVSTLLGKIEKGATDFHKHIEEILKGQDEESSENERLNAFNDIVNELQIKKLPRNSGVGSVNSDLKDFDQISEDAKSVHRVQERFTKIFCYLKIKSSNDLADEKDSN